MFKVALSIDERDESKKEATEFVASFFEEVFEV